MARTKGVSRKKQPPKRKASSTHSSQSDFRPHKVPKQDDRNSDASGSEIVMINSRDLKNYRKRQRQHEQQQQQQQQQRQRSAQRIAVDEFTQPRGIRPPQGNGSQRRARLLPEPNPRVFEPEDEEDEAQEEFYISYGGANEQERDRRISGWAGSVAGAGAGDPDIGVEYDDASVMSSSVSASKVGYGQGEDDEDGKTEEEDAIPSIETGNARNNAGSNNRAAVPAQHSGQNLRRSTRVGRGTRILNMRLPDPLFDPVAHLNKPAAKSLGLFDRPQKASIKGRNTVRRALPREWYYNDQETSAEFLERTVPKNQRLSLESNGALFKTSHGSRNSTVKAFPGAPKQHTAVKYFDRDDTANHAYTFASNKAASYDSNSSSRNISGAQPLLDRDNFTVCTSHYGESSSSVKPGIKYFDRGDSANRKYTSACDSFASISENSSKPSSRNTNDAQGFFNRDSFPVSYGGSPSSDGTSNYAFLGASKRDAGIKYFVRDDPANHKYTFATSVSDNNSISSSRSAGSAEPFFDRDSFPISDSGSHFSDEASICAFSDFSCHRVIASNFSEHDSSSHYSETWIYRRKSERQYYSSPASSSPSEGEGYHGRDDFSVEQRSVSYSSGPRDYFLAEQHNFHYSSEPREDRDYFPMQTYSLDYEGDGQINEEPASVAGGAAEEGAEAYENGDPGGASGDVILSIENNAGQEGSEDGDPDGEDDEHKSEISDSSSDNSDEDNENNEDAEDSEDKEMEIEEDDFCKAYDEASLQDETEENNGATDTVIACTNRDLWGRIRPPGFENRPDPPESYSRTSIHGSQVHQYMPLSTMYYATNSAAAIEAASERHGYDFNRGLRPPQRSAAGPRQGLQLAQRGGLPDVPFAGPQTRQNTASNRIRRKPLSPGQGYVSVPIAEQQAAQTLHALEGGETIESRVGEVDKGECDEGGDAQNVDAEENGAGKDGAGNDGEE